MGLTFHCKRSTKQLNSTQLNSKIHDNTCVCRHSAGHDLQADSVSKGQLSEADVSYPPLANEAHKNASKSARVVNDATQQSQKAAPIHENTQPPVCSRKGKARQRCAMLTESPRATTKAEDAACRNAKENARAAYVSTSLKQPLSTFA